MKENRIYELFYSGKMKEELIKILNYIFSNIKTEEVVIHDYELMKVLGDKEITKERIEEIIMNLVSIRLITEISNRVEVLSIIYNIEYENNQMYIDLEEKMRTDYKDIILEIIKEEDKWVSEK